MSEHQATHKKTLAGEIRRRTGLNPAKCYQCGKCSAGCPMAEETTLRPHDILRLIQRGKADKLFADDSIWLCLTCETCTARCPNNVDPARIIDALREIAQSGGEGLPPRAIQSFHKAFLKQIRKHGRVFEFGVILGFKMRSGKLFADVMKAPAMMKRGKLALSPRNVKGLDDVRRIFDACLAAESQEVQ